MLIVGRVRSFYVGNLVKKWISQVHFLFLDLFSVCVWGGGGEREGRRGKKKFPRTYYVHISKYLSVIINQKL